MKIKEIMETSVKLVNPTTSLREAAELMRDCDCGYLPVGADDRLQGAVTDRDIVIRGIAEGRNAEQTSVQEVMTSTIMYCYEDEDIEQASEKMQSQQVRRLVVLNRDKRLRGVITLGDIARATNDKHLTGETECGVAKAA